MREEDVNVISYAKIATVAFGLGNYEASGGGIYESKSERSPHMKLFSLPSTRLAEHEQMLLLVENFNGWCLQWGSRVTYMRGHVLVEAFAELDVLLMNFRTSHIFRGSGLGSIQYLTYVSIALASKITRQGLHSQ